MARDSVKIRIDGDDSGFKKVMSGIGGTATKTFGIVAKGITAGVGTAVAALGTVSAASINAFGEYEQLAGGAELMFGKAYDFIADKAKSAFKDVQMSQNEYLKQVNGFAVGLRTALGGNEQAAAELADRIVTAEADIVAATGRTAEDVQNAFNGIMKSNFTMIDNLGLGITPTKEGFQEMIDKVNQWKAANGEATNYQISNLADCQSALIDYIEMQGMSGYAAAEASGTIQGSLAMVKASWENLMIGLSDPSQDLDVLIDDVINSATLLFENLGPVIQSILESLPTMICTLGEKLLQEIPVVVNNLLPSLVDMAGQLINTLVDALTENATVLGNTAINILMILVDTILSNLPQIIQLALTLITTLATGIAQSLPELIPAVIDTIFTIVDTLLNNIDMLIDVAIELIIALADGLIIALPEIIEKIPVIVEKLVNAFIENAPKLVGAAAQLVGKLAVGLIAAVPSLISAAWSLLGTLINSIKSYVTEYVPACGKNIVDGLWKGISGSWDWLVTKIKEWCGNIIEKIKGIFGIKSPSRVMRDEVGKMIPLGLAGGIENNIGVAMSAMGDMGKSLLNLNKQYLIEEAKENDKAARERAKALKKQIEEEEKIRDGKFTALERQLKFGIVTEEEYYEELEKLRDEYFAKGSDEWFEYTEKIFDYQEKQAEALAKNISEHFDKSYEEVEKKRLAMSDKLSKTDDLFVTQTFKHMGLGGSDIVNYKLYDFSVENEAAEKYLQNMLAIKQKLYDLGYDSDTVTSFFGELANLSTEEVLNYASAFSKATDEEIRKSIDGYTRLLKTSEETSGLYTDELETAIDESAKYMVDELTKAGYTIPENFFEAGKLSAQSFGEAFAEQMNSFFTELQKRVDVFTAGISQKLTAAGTGSINNSRTYNNEYHINGGDTCVVRQIEAYNTRLRMQGAF